MFGQANILRVSLVASVIWAYTGTALAAGMGGVSMGGMTGGMSAGGGLSGVASAAAAAAGAANTLGASTPGSGGHLPIGANDGPSGLSASSGHNPFGNSLASSAWASLPALDPDLPGVVAPSLPGLAKSGSSAPPDANVRAPVTAEGQGRLSDVNSGSQAAVPTVQRSLSSSEADSTLR